jgi:hypothetical protein
MTYDLRNATRPICRGYHAYYRSAYDEQAPAVPENPYTDPESAHLNPDEIQWTLGWEFAKREHADRVVAGLHVRIEVGEE